MFEDEKIDFIESLPEADSILIIWIKLLTLAGKCNVGGFIFLTEKIPFTVEMLAHRFRRPLSTVKLAVETLIKLEMITPDDNDFLKITNWEKHQNIEGMEKIREQTRKRVAKYRKNQKLLKDSNVTVTLRNATEEEGDIDIEEDREVVVEPQLSKKDINMIIKKWNSLKLQQLKSINPNTNRHKMLKARISEYSLAEIGLAIDKINESSFLKGQNKKNWIITFDWFVRPNNFAKVLEGNYEDRRKDDGSHEKHNAKNTEFDGYNLSGIIRG